VDTDAEGEAEGLGLRGEGMGVQSCGVEVVVPAEVLLGRLGWH